MTSLSTSLQRGSGLSGKWMGGKVFLRCLSVLQTQEKEKNSPLKHYFCFYYFRVANLKGTYVAALNSVFLQLATQLFLDVLGHKINTVNL